MLKFMLWSNLDGQELSEILAKLHNFIEEDINFSCGVPNNPARLASKSLLSSSRVPCMVLLAAILTV